MTDKKRHGKIFSHSRISAFEKCRLKYKFRYVDEIIPEVERTIESHLGSSVHKALEWLYNQVRRKKMPSAEELIMIYSENWNEEYDDEIPIVKKNFTKEDYFNKGVEFLINYYTENHPFDDNTLEVEKEILINLDSEGEYKLRGFIDRIAYNAQKDEYEIHDYKTSGTFPSDEEIENDRQLALYAIAIKEIYGKEKNVRLIWHYLSFRKKIHSERTNEQLEKLREDTLNVAKEINSTKNFPPTKSPLCHWCEYKNICPVWGNNFEKQTKLDGFAKLEKGENGDKLDVFK